MSYTKATNCENDPTKIPNNHKEFFHNQLPYYIDEENNLFIHGGFDRHRKIEDEEDESVTYLFYNKPTLYILGQVGIGISF